MWNQGAPKTLDVFILFNLNIAPASSMIKRLKLSKVSCGKIAITVTVTFEIDGFVVGLTIGSSLVILYER